jgi:tRNA pseudouridine55 synthase
MDKVSSYQDPGQVLLIDKPLEWTSFDIVKKVRNTIRIKKVGHAGTLDPLATGLLILCTGKKTKQIDLIQGQEKEYLCTLVLGKTTASFDLETPVEEGKSIDHITPALINDILENFRGEQEQVPPAHSAVKVGGERAYKKARAGEKVELKSRKVHIHELQLTSLAIPEVSLKIVCSKGTYIRSLVRDIGEYLNCGAYMKSLRRTRIGEYNVKDALSIDDFVAAYAGT